MVGAIPYSSDDVWGDGSRRPGRAAGLGRLVGRFGRCKDCGGLKFGLMAVEKSTLLFHWISIRGWQDEDTRTFASIFTVTACGPSGTSDAGVLSFKLCSVQIMS
jgi:hypothetical protein